MLGCWCVDVVGDSWRKRREGKASEHQRVHERGVGLLSCPRDLSTSPSPGQPHQIRFSCTLPLRALPSHNPSFAVTVIEKGPRSKSCSPSRLKLKPARTTDLRRRRGLCAVMRGVMRRELVDVWGKLARPLTFTPAFPTIFVSILAAASTKTDTSTACLRHQQRPRSSLGWRLALRSSRSCRTVRSFLPSS
jgi:hypothetical protein